MHYTQTRELMYADPWPLATRQITYTATIMHLRGPVRLHEFRQDMTWSETKIYHTLRSIGLSKAFDTLLVVMGFVKTV